MDSDVFASKLHPSCVTPEEIVVIVNINFSVGSTWRGPA